jgi:ABC-type phosphate transport system permease subunit
VEVSQPSRANLAARLVIAAVLVGGLLMAVPESRWILLAILVVSVPIGIVVAVILQYWHKRRPLKESETSSKRPLGLDG